MTATQLIEKKERLLSNLRFLNEHGISYEVYNNGMQLNFKWGKEIVAFYPTTNKWVWRGKTFNGDAKGLLSWKNLKGIGEDNRGDL